jgi:hypothetical protein
MRGRLVRSFLLEGANAMSFKQIKQHIHLDDDYTGADERKIWAAIKDGYLHSATAKAMFDKLLHEHDDITINKENDFAAQRGGNNLYIGMHYLDDLVLLNDHGQGVRYNFEIALLHEFSHALNNVGDPTPAQLAAHNYVGDNLVYENQIRHELGFAPRLSYYTVVDDTWTASHAPAYAGSYSNGQKLDMTVVSFTSHHHDYNNLDTTGLGNSSDLLMDGEDNANNFQAGAGDDFLYGWGRQGYT